MQNIRLRPRTFSIRPFLWQAYLFLIPYHRIFYFPLTGAKIQIPELAFIPWFFSSIGKFKNLLSRDFWIPFDFVVIFWPLTILIPGFLNGFNSDQFFEFLGAFYLVAVYFLIRLSGASDFLKKASAILIYSSTITATLGLIGWLLYVFLKIETPLINIRPYPYFGYVAQAVSFTTTANMQASIIMIGMILHISRMIFESQKQKFMSWTILALLVFGFISTLSKTLLPLAAGILFVVAFHLKRNNKIFQSKSGKGIVITIIFLCALIYSLGSHFYVSSFNQKKFEELYQWNYISDKPIVRFNFKGKEYAIIPTSYWLNKKASLLAFFRSKGVGVGGGNFNVFVSGLKDENLYPIDYPDYDPHSSYAGTLAELGIVGFMVLMAFSVLLAFMSYRNLINDVSWVSVALAGTLIAISIEAIAIDVMNFRHYWCIFGLIAAAYSSIATLKSNSFLKQ